MSNATDRVRNATAAAIGSREVTRGEVLETAQAIASVRVCGYIFGMDTPLVEIVNDLVTYNIPDQIIE